MSKQSQRIIESTQWTNIEGQIAKKNNIIKDTLIKVGCVEIKKKMESFTNRVRDAFRSILWGQETKILIIMDGNVTIVHLEVKIGIKMAKIMALKGFTVVYVARPAAIAHKCYASR